MLRKLMLVPIVGAIALLLLAGPASAAPKVPKGDAFEFPAELTQAGQLCDFAVTLKGISGQVVRTTLPDGTTILTGPAVITITNVTNELSTTLNISGPTFTSGDDAILTGPAIILLFPGVPSNPAGPGILATTGQATLEDGVFDIDTFTGTTQDVCEQLAE
jgi:hypothetical protein